MTIPYIPQIDPAITESLASLGDTVARIARPTLSYDIALRQSLADHPELIQQLANIGARNPGQLQRFVGPKAAAALGSVQQSPEDLASENIGKLKANIAERQNTGINSAPAPLAQAAGQEGGVSALSGGVGTVDLAKIPLQLPALQLASQLPQDPAQLQYGTDAKGNARLYNPGDVAKDFLAGKAPANLDAALRNNPTYREGYISAIQNQQELNKIDAEYSRATLFAGVKSDAAYVSQGNAAGVSKDTVKAYNEQPIVRQTALNLLDHPEQAQTPEQQELLKFARYLVGQAQSTATKQEAPARSTIAKAEATLANPKATNPEKAAAAAAYSESLRTIGIAKGDSLTPRVAFEPIVSALGQGIGYRTVYYDGKGNKVDKNFISSFLGGNNTQTQTQTQPQKSTLSADQQTQVNNSIQLIKSNKGTLEQLEASSLPAEIKQAVKDSLGAK
jgi:hypothetical protein